jgi:hypothetical protein
VTARRSSALRPARRSRTPTRNGGSERSAASSWTAPSSGTTPTSSGSSAGTSSTTTRTDPTALSVNAHPTVAKASNIGPASRSDDTPPAADSSTSTAKQPEPPPQQPTDHQHVTFDAPAPHHTRKLRRVERSLNNPNEFPAPTGTPDGLQALARLCRLPELDPNPNPPLPDVPAPATALLRWAQTGQSLTARPRQSGVRIGQGGLSRSERIGHFGPRLRSEGAAPAQCNSALTRGARGL